MLARKIKHSLLLIVRVIVLEKIASTGRQSFDRVRSRSDDWQSNPNEPCREFARQSQATRLSTLNYLPP